MTESWKVSCSMSQISEHERNLSSLKDEIKVIFAVKKLRGKSREGNDGFTEHDKVTVSRHYFDSFPSNIRSQLSSDICHRPT